MNTLLAGFARVDITPQLGIDMEGYYKVRKADGVLDPLQANALALSCGSTRIVLMSLDLCILPTSLVPILKKSICQRTGLPEQAVHIHVTHTHTGPVVKPEWEDMLVQQYIAQLQEKLAEAAEGALADLKTAKLGFGVGQAPNIAFVRRYRMKDGSVKTNPGVNNPDIVAPIGRADEQVNVLRLDQKDGKSIVLVNYGNHPDTVGGCGISADWPGFVRSTVERALENTKCIFFNGAQGDVNHVNVHPKGGDLNGMYMDFDDVSRGYAHAKHMGQVVAGAVLQVYEKVLYTDVPAVKLMDKTIQVPSNMPKPEDMPTAYHIHELYAAGRDAELPYEGMELTTKVAEAERMIRLEHGPESFSMTLSAVAVGPIAFMLIPGEPFTGVGRGLKQTEGFDLILPCCCTDGYEGYFPMQDSYAEGGYEAKSSPYAEGVAELIVAEGKMLLDSLKG